MWTPQGPRRCGTPACPPSAGESCGSRIVLPPPIPGASFLLSTPRAAAGMRPHPIPGVPGTPWLEGAGRAGAGMAGPDPNRGVSWGVSDPNLVLFFPAQPTIPWRRVPTSGARASLGLQKGAGCAGALGPRCTSPLPARGPSPELMPEVAGNLGFASSLAREASALGRPRPLLHFECLHCTQFLSWEIPGDSREARWPDREIQGSILPWGAPWVLGCPPHLCASVTAGAERQASERCDALYFQVCGIWIPKTCSPREQRPCLELAKFIVSTLHVMNECMNQ